MEALTIKAIRDALSQIEALAPGTANQKPRAALKSIIAFLEPHEEKTLPSVLSELEAARPTKVKSLPRRAKGTAKPAATRVPAVANEQIVAEVVASLVAADESVAAFSDTLAAIKANKSLRKVELINIVKDYAGHTSSVASKEAAYGILERTFNQRFMLSQRRA